MALAVTAAAGATWAALTVLGASPVLAGVGACVVAGGAAYLAVRRRVTLRLAEARRALTETGPVDGLAADRAGSDDLDALVDEAGRAGRALRQEVARLERLADYRRTFMGDVSHELRTPIFAISGFAESLLDGALDDPRVRVRFVEKILTNARRLDALARDLADISSIESGELRMRSEAFDMGSFSREAIEALEQLGREREIAFEVDVPESLPRVIGDRGRLQQVLANLLENAVRYTETGGHVGLAAAEVPGGVQVVVTDDGIGIAPEDVPRVTERFFRVDRSRSRNEGGTGLGLAIVKHILEAHGARLKVESRLGEGSAFSFVLPAERTGAGGGTAFATGQVSSPSPSAR